jgi:copper transport protein
VRFPGPRFARGSRPGLFVDVGVFMFCMTRWVLAAGVFLAALAWAASPASVDAHAALERSDPPAGASLPEPPTEIRLTFTEPLESAYTGADLLDGAGDPVPDVAVSSSPDNDHQLIVVPSSPLADGNYTVAWRTLSAADGHTLQGYFGFAVGVAASGELTVAPAPAGSETARALSRGLALIGLAALLAIAPLTLAVLDSATRAVPGLAAPLTQTLRRYGVVASLLAIAGSLAALAAQATTIAPDTPVIAAIRETLADTRYGQLWQIRLLLLALVIAAVALALGGPGSWRRPALLAGAIAALVTPLPFSLISHAAAQQEGRSAAVAADALHLLAAAVWAGGLLMLVFALLPALRPLPPDERRVALRAALPRFSIVALSAWAVMSLSGLYAAWLQVGTLEALRDTPYGQSLLLKLGLLLPVLALAAFHLALGRRLLRDKAPGRFVATIAAEALLVVVVLLVVGRLIGLEPAREVLSARTPSQIVVSLSFATDEGQRKGQLSLSPGVAGPNDFTLRIDGSPLPAEAEGILRFALPNRDLGAQELRLPLVSQNEFRAEGSDLALPGDWQVETIVRAIGTFSWSTESVIAIGQTPPPAPQPNPAPLFAPPAIAGMVAIAIGALALAFALLASGATPSRRAIVAAAGVAILGLGAAAIAAARVAPPPPVVAAIQTPAAPTPEASPSAADGHHTMNHHATPESGTPAPELLPGPGTVIQGDGFSIEFAATPDTAGPVDVTITLRADDDTPFEDARVVVLSDMPAMAMGRTETPATETAPGQYEASSVPLVMQGEWRLSIRVSPRAKPTQVFSFAVSVP